MAITTGSARAQNSYPSSGDALIHGLTIGTGPGTASSTNTALGANALISNTGGGQNVAVGVNALYSNTGGGYNYGTDNTAVGFQSMYWNTLGFYNTALGASALTSNGTGSCNVAVGLSTMFSNGSGSYNTAIGFNASAANSSGNNNSAFGMVALDNNSTGNSNVAVGAYSLYYATNVSNTVAVGDSALFNNTGSSNTAIGSKTLYSTTSGYNNTALGFQGLYNNTTGYANVAGGYKALYANQGGGANAAYGSVALYANSSGSDNTASGYASLYSNTSGNYNTAGGTFAVYYNTTGSGNTGYGLEALLNNTTGSDNTAIGEYAGPSSGNLTNSTALGYGATTTASNSVFVGNTSVTSIGGVVNFSMISDGRVKKNITQNVPGLAFINKLTPITYNFDVDGMEAMRQKMAPAARDADGAALSRTADDPVIKQAMKEKAAIVYSGFVAQDVDKAASSIGYNFSGVDRPKNDQQSFYGLRYSDFVVPLVKAVQELSAQNDSLQQANAQLSQRLDQIEQLLGISKSANSTTLSLSSARLFQNIPNPFNQTTQINYFLPQNTGTALIQITGMHGETIKSIALSGTGAGQVSVQTTQLAAGTYTYSLFVDGNLIDTKKMVLMK